MGKSQPLAGYFCWILFAGPGLQSVFPLMAKVLNVKGSAPQGQILGTLCGPLILGHWVKDLGC